MVWEDYLSLLSWRGCPVFLRDFRSLKAEGARSVDDLKNTVSHPETKQFLTTDKYWWKQAEKDFKTCGQNGFRLTWPGKEDYPTAFFKLDCPPVSLTYMGNLPSGEKYFPLTVVGSRKGHETALNWMDFYLPKIIQTGKVCLVSGGARGVDQKAHSIAIRLGLPTVCFLPSGLSCFYPADLNSFKREVLNGGGAFISCFPLSIPMRKSFFHIRNRLMACYSKLVFVAQAQLRSGTMLTAQKALDCGVPVATLPGPPLSSAWTGNLQLIYDGAFLLRDGVDLSLLIESLVFG